MCVILLPHCSTSGVAEIFLGRIWTTAAVLQLVFLRLCCLVYLLLCVLVYPCFVVVVVGSRVVGVVPLVLGCRWRLLPVPLVYLLEWVPDVVAVVVVAVRL